jgi:hypothetical protein
MFLSLLNDACPWFDECEVTQRKKKPKPNGKRAHYKTLLEIQLL